MGEGERLGGGGGRGRCACVIRRARGVYQEAPVGVHFAVLGLARVPPLAPTSASPSNSHSDGKRGEEGGAITRPPAHRHTQHGACTRLSSVSWRLPIVGHLGDEKGGGGKAAQAARKPRPAHVPEGPPVGQRLILHGHRRGTRPGADSGRDGGIWPAGGGGEKVHGVVALIVIR